MSPVAAQPASGLDTLTREEGARLGPAAFTERYLRPGRPLLIRGGLTLLGPVGSWTLGSLREPLGDIPTRVISTRGRPVRYGAPFDQEDMLTRDLLDLIEAWTPETGVNHLTHTAISLRRSCPALWREVDPSPFFPPGLATAVSLRIGTGHTDSALHNDFANNNLSAQICGHKRWTLFAPDQHRHLAAYDYTGYRSRIDPDAPDLEAFPEFAGALRAADLVLGPGDLLFVPAYWWHRVQAIDSSISLRVWGLTLPENHLGDPALDMLQRLEPDRLNLFDDLGAQVGCFLEHQALSHAALLLGTAREAGSLSALSLEEAAQLASWTHALRAGQPLPEGPASTQGTLRRWASLLS